MIRLAAILIILVLACLVTVGYPVFAQVPPEQKSGSVSATGKSDSGISQLLLDSINERGRGGTQQGAVTRDAVTRDSTGRRRADAGVVGSSGATGGEELLSGVTKDDFETTRTVDELVRFDNSGNVEVYIHLKSTDEASLQQVRDAVERVEIEGAEYGLIQAWVDPDDLGAVASLEAVKRITPPDYGYTKKGSTLTEGDAVHRANLVRAFSGLTGEGVKVGVISDGVDAWTSARSRGDLPSRIEINPNQDSEGHEGTALLEIVHDLAPDAELAFSGSESSLGMAQAILWLANDAFDGEGADVIVDDLGYFFQPFFEDGIVAQAAADAVAGGAVFASAAGNYAQEHYEGDFVDGGDGFHAFDGSSDITMRLRSPFSTRVTLQWNDQFGASGNDYDLYICPAGLTPTIFNLFNGICDASADLQNGNDDPLEVASLYGEAEVDVFIRKDGGQNRRLEMFFFDSYPREYGVEEGGIVHHVAVPGVLAVGAVDADEPGNDDLRSYSDQGPSRIYFPSFETRQKPDVVTSDGVSVTGSGGFPSHFNGTSAAAPHVAGIAALLVEAQRLADPAMTKKEVADAVTQKIRDTAIDLGPAGHDNRFGYGRADALAAVESLDQLSGTTFTVESTGDGADSNTGDGVCDDGNGNCTLRAAIQEANRVDGSTIEFNISGSGTRTIQPASALPTISRTVFIDGFSQSSASSTNYRIELDGTNAGTNANGLTMSGTESWVRGLVINRFGGNGIVLQGSGGKQVIEGNRIGTNVSGSSDSGNGKSGVLVSGADGVILRGNLISGNDGHGVEISGGADDAIIDRNIFGANAGGTSDLGNTGSGIHISNGDDAAISDNVITGNDSHGVSLTGSSTYDNVVAENHIGVNQNGASISNSGSGVHIGLGARDNTIEHNTIAHNTGDGVTVVSSSSTGNTVWENSIYSNGALGVDLNDDGVTANDTNDPDSGPNNLQNYAVLTSAGLSSDAGSIGFNLYVTQGNRYTVDFYASDSCDGSGSGEGKEWVGYARVVPATSGDRHFVVHTFRGTLNQYDPPSGTFITATVTLDGSTSEFSPCIQSTALPRLTLSEDAIEVEEGGTTNTTYTVRLSSSPSHDATLDLTIEGDDAVTVSPTPLTFTTGNWANTQTVTVTAASDADPEDEYTVIQHKLTIDSKQYVSEWLPVRVVDDDVPDLALVIGGNHRVTGSVSMEEGQFATYPVVLTEEPDDDVTVRVYSSSSSALRVVPSSLTFTKDEYDTAQSVTITALVDSDAGDELVNVYHEVLIDGSYYEVARVRAFINDPIFPSLTLSTPTLSVNEGETATYTIVPAAEPSRNFTITLESSDTESVTVSPPTVTFTRGANGNWQTPQTIMVTGVQDGDEFDDVATILHKSTYSGAVYFLGSGVEVTVADGNRAPYFEEGVKTTRSIDENSGQGAAVGAPVVAIDLNNDTLTYTLDIEAGGPFSIDSSGQITLGAGVNLDYEASSDQAVKVTATDPDGLFDTIEVEIEVANVNEPPVVMGISGAEDTEFRENRTGTVGRFRATDPERDSFEWSVIGTDHSFFYIDSRGYLTFIDPPDFEADADANNDNVYEPTVVARDTGGSFGTLNIKVTVTDVNEPPIVSADSGQTTFAVNEDAQNLMAFFTASDPEGSNIQFSWSLSGTDAGDFLIIENIVNSERAELIFRNLIDYESPADSNRNNEYLVTVRATDEGGLRGSLDLTVTVNDVNEPPTITGDETLSFPENATRSVATYRADDPERGMISWSLSGDDRGDFEISDTGVLTFANVPDFENPADLNGDNDYLVTIEAYDGRHTATLEVTVTVTNSTGAEEPTITTTSRPVLTYQENGTGTVYTFRATDPQRGTIRWSLDGDDAGDFLISESGALTFRNPPDFESPTDEDGGNVYEITVVATDEQGLTDSFDVTIIVTNYHENLEPAITTGPSSGLTYHQLNYQENRTSTVYTYSARNYGSGSLSWSLSGTDAGAFTITGDSRSRGVLTFDGTPDFESPDDLDDDNDYEITVVVTNAGGYTDGLDVVVTVTDVNEGPEVTGRDSFNVEENQDLPSATYRATDPEGDTITRWNLGGRDGSDFNISQDETLTFRSLPDYERPADSNRDNVYEVEIRPYDGRNYGSFDVTVIVEDVNEAPTITTTSTSAKTLRQPENRTSRLYTYRATDPEGATIMWSVGGTDRGFFTINERGEFSFKETSPPDYEIPGDSGGDNIYDVMVQATDDDSNTARLEVTVTVTEVNEGPEVTSGGNSFTVRENQDWQGASFTASDPEGSTITRWNLGGRDGGDFTISETGLMTFRSAPDYERPADSNRDNVYEVEVRPYDGRYYGSHEVMVMVEDVDEITGPASVNRSENFEGVLATYSATGRGDLTVVPVWRLSGTDRGGFTITEDGELTFRSIPDHERPTDSNRDNVYSFAVQASDDRYYGTLDVTVTVTPVNEPPTITTTGRTTFTRQENDSAVFYTFRAIDPEGSAVTWSTGGQDGGDFAIDGGALKFGSPPDFENSQGANGNEYHMMVQATDDGSNTASLPVTVTVTDLNEGPEVMGPAQFTIAENQGLSNAVYAARDPEGSYVALWSVAGRDGGDFFITQGGTLVFRSPPDYERPADSNRDNLYEVSVQPSDGRNTGSYAVTVTVTDVNEPPEFYSGSRDSFTQPENRVSTLYTFRATDPEGSSVTWSVGGADGNDFTIDERGALSFTDPPDFDSPSDVGGDNVYNVTVQASDGQVSPAPLPVTVTVTEVNEGPVITRQGNAPGSVPENQAQNMVLARYTATDPERPTVKITQWSPSGQDGGDFVIDALGQLRFRNSPDYERPADSNRDNVYEVTIRASDGRYRSTLEEIQTVTVTDVNEAPTITTTGRTAFSQPENRVSTLYTFRATDPEGGTVTWTAAGTDGKFFTMDERGRFSFMETGPPDFDAPGDEGRDNVYDVTVQAGDDAFNTASLEVTVTVTNNNEGVEPTISTRRPPATYRENGTSTVYTFRATDPQRGAIRWSLRGTDGDDFNISEAGALTFASLPDFESPDDANRDNEYELVVVATDDEGNTDSVEFTITVTDDAEGVEPTISTRRPPSTYRENGTSTIYTFRASDPQRDPISWSLDSNDASDFTITRDSGGRGVLTFNDPPDFENPVDSDQDNEYELTVVASDGPNSDRLSFTITVTDLNEGPEIRLERTAITSVPENYDENQALADYTATDPEDPGILVASWSTAGRDGGDFVISELGELRFRYSPDYERPADSDRDNVYEVTVRASDGRVYGTLEEPLIVTVTEVNEAPVITTKSNTEFSRRENTTTVLYTYRATDQDDNDVIRWSVEGADGEDFAIYAGVLTLGLLPDYELPVDSDRDNEYRITVVATDRAGLRDTVDASITITDQTEGPVIAGRQAFIVTENHDIAQALGSYTATDAKDMRPVYPRWSLSGSDGGDFVIDPATGSLTFRNTPDYDRPADGNRDNLYQVTVRGYDGRAYGNLNVTVTVTAVNEPPAIRTGSRTEFTYSENRTGSIYTYRATDPEGSTIGWSVSGVDRSFFSIDSRGTLSFASPLDFEARADRDGDNMYAITVVAADDGGLRGELNVAVTVTDVNEGPEVTGTTSFTVMENLDWPGASFTATDPEGDAVTRWSLSGSDGGDFNISENGELTFRNTPDYDRPADSNRDNEYLVTVRAYDVGNRYGSLDVAVTVTPVNEEAPVVTGRDNRTVSENTTSAIYTYRATDADRDDTITWSTSGADGHLFEMSEQGALSFREAPDYENPRDSGQDNLYELDVVATDSEGLTGELMVSITVTEVNEGPVVTGTPTYTIQEFHQSLANATYSATDPERDSISSWRLVGSDGGDFTITDTSELTDRNTAQLRFRYPPDVDRPADSNRDNEYLVTIRAYDNRGRYGSYDVTVTVTAANEPPVITGSDARNFPENGTGTIYTYRATDPEGDEFTWIQPAGDDGQLFDISDRGALTFKNPPDFDIAGDANRDNDYQVTVQARDDRGNTGTFDVTVTVTDVNEGPEIAETGANTDITVQEYTDPNQDPALPTLATYTARDPEGSAISRWSLSGSDGGDFLISENGDLTFRYAPDHDSPVDSNRDNEYLVSVRAYDATNRYGSLDVTVTVRGVNEADPVVTGSQSLSFRENTAVATRLYTYRATDADRDTTITWSVRGQDDNDFDIDRDDGVLTFKEEPDYEQPADSDTNNEYLVTVVATDDEGRAGTLDVTVTVTAVDEGPEISGTTSYSVLEGQELTGATYSARDPEDPTIVVTNWRTAGTDGRDFTISQDGELSFRNTPDYDDPADSNRDNEYLVTIQVSDGRYYGSLDVTVAVIDENEAAPVVTGRETLSFRENATTETRLYTYRATDLDRDTTIAWSVEGDDRDDFEIGEGVLTFKEEPDYENPTDSTPGSPQRDNVYEITVVASDGTNRDTLDVAITVTDVNEGPEVTGQATRTVSENFDEVVATYTATDPEGSAVTRWNLAGPDSGDFSITDTSEQTGQYTADLSFRNAPDFDRPVDSNRDNEYLVTVRPYDGRYYGNHEVTVTVTASNEPPAITGSNARTFRENGTGTIYTYRATDPEGDGLTWSVGGADGSYFDISDRGVLAFKSPPDFESPPRPDDNEYQVTVETTDDNADKGTFDVVVTVTDVNEGPVIEDTITNTAFTVQENHDQVLFTYSAKDPEDPDAEITRWSVTGTDGGDFSINEDGELKFRDTPDFERPADSNRDNEYLFTVRASDGRYYGTLEVTVTVEAVNEAPEFRSGSTTEFAYQENGTSDLYTYRATDPEGGDVTWHLTGDDSSAFDISETGVLTFSDSPDYEDPADADDDNVYQVTVVARDEQGNARLEVTVTVTNLTDRLLIITGTAQVGRTLTADTSGIADPEGLAKVSYSYQWIRNEGETDADIAGATDPTYTPSGSDVGKTVKVKVSFTDDADNAETLTSESTAAVAATVPTEPLSLTVTRGRQIQELDAAWRSPASNGGSAITGYKVQWKEAADSWDTAADASEATVTGTTHTITGLTGGVEYAVRVIATNDVGDGSASTEATGTPAGGVSQQQNSQPENTEPTGLPTIGGTAQVGETLTADIPGIADEDGLDDVSYSYQWIRSDGNNDTYIAGETSSTYTLVSADVGKAIKVKVTFTDDRNNAETLTSAATGAVAVAPNRTATGAPTIGGTVQVGQTLTVDTTGIADEDGLDDVSYSYQWIAGGSDIDGATGSTYTLTTSQQGQAIQVRVSFTDDRNSAETLTSEATGAVAAAANRAATGLPTIGGTVQVDQTLTAVTKGITDADGLTNVLYSYQWIRTDGGTDTDIAGEMNSTYTLVSADVGKAIKVKVSFTDDANNAESLTSAATGAVAAAAPPANTPATGLPTISGTAQVGETLTAGTTGISDADGLDNTAFAYQWLADGTEINGATASTYTLADADEGKAIKVKVTFTDDGGHDEQLTSVSTDAVVAATPPANTPATGLPTISGTAQVGETLTSSTTGIADDDGLTGATFTYQWLADGADIAGATGSSYTLVDADAGKVVKVRVSFTDDRDDEESLTSEPTAAVAEADPTGPPPAPQNLTAVVNGDGHIVLSWEAPDDDSITGYQILRRRPTEGEDTLLVYVADTQSTAATFTDTDVTAGVQHAYRVKAINAAGAGPVSNFVNVTP